MYRLDAPVPPGYPTASVAVEMGTVVEDCTAVDIVAGTRSGCASRVEKGIFIPEKGKQLKQIVQNYKTGEVRLANVPAPAYARPGQVLVENRVSLISVGTEKYMLEMGRKSLVGKALSRPDLARQVVDKACSEGISEAWRQAMGRLDAPVPMGYSSAGVVVKVGAGVLGFTVGERVACAGPGYAGHAELVHTPENLCAKIPQGVSFEVAAFVALGGIALQALRIAEVSLGETVVVIGLGLLGQLVVQLLAASGCHVIGMDPDIWKARLAQEHGAEAATSDYPSLAVAVRRISASLGADAVLIFAATPSNEPVERAATVCRERGRIVAAGMVGLEVPRQLFYEKELQLVVPRAWGPGLYDSDYTEKGLKYPIAYARWTAQGNMSEFLAQVAKRAVCTDHLITHRIPLERASEAYQVILNGKEPYLGVLLTYEGKPNFSRTIVLKGNSGSGDKGIGNSEGGERGNRKDQIGVGVIGAGFFANGTLLPSMKGMDGLRFLGVATSRGISARHTADRFGFEYCTTDYRQILDDPKVNLVFILTRHGSHAQFVVEALQARKHVFVEKPLALNLEQLSQIMDTFCVQRSTFNLQLMVGFNRRFSPTASWLKEGFGDAGEPLAVHCTVNAGLVPIEHWVHDPEQGGGRILGEVCHFVDLIQYLTGSLPVRVYAEALHSRGNRSSDITLKMLNGGLGSIAYLSGGDKRFPRERVEVIGAGAVGVIDNFRAASFTRGGRTWRKRNWLVVDRGHRVEIEALVEAIRKDGPAPVNFEEYVSTTLATLAIEESLKNCHPVVVECDYCC